LWLSLTGASPFQRNAEMVGDCLQAILSPDNAAHRENRRPQGSTSPDSTHKIDAAREVGRLWPLQLNQ